MPIRSLNNTHTLFLIFSVLSFLSPLLSNPHGFLHVSTNNSLNFIAPDHPIKHLLSIFKTNPIPPQIKSK